MWCAWRLLSPIPTNREGVSGMACSQQAVPLKPSRLVRVGFRSLHAHHIKGLGTLSRQAIAQGFEILSVGSPAVEQHQSAIHGA